MPIMDGSVEVIMAVGGDVVVPSLDKGIAFSGHYPVVYRCVSVHEEDGYAVWRRFIFQLIPA